MMFQRKIYDTLLEWKAHGSKEKALLVEGARRIGKSTIVEELGKNEYKSYLLIDIVHTKNLSVNDKIVCIPCYMTMCL